MTESLPNHALTEKSNILITGCTGMIGGELLKKLLINEKHEGTIWTLVRAKSKTHARQRIKDRLLRSAVSPDEMENLPYKVVAGDVSKPDWGISKNELKSWFPHLDIIIHCASDTSFLHSENVLECNVNSTINLIKMVEDSGHKPLVVYISTAANIGKVTNTVVTEDMNRSSDGEHHNLYTRSKAVCESMLTEAGIPSLIFRPSIVLSAGVEDSLFAGSILWMIPLMYHFNALPLDKNSKLDIVPVGFVVDCIVDLLRKEKLNYSTYHISTGVADSITVEESFNLTDKFYKRSPINFIHPDKWTDSLHRKYVDTKRKRELYHRIKYYFPFLNMDVVYDNSRLKNELGELKIQPLKKYINGLLSQITEAHALKESVKP